MYAISYGIHNFDDRFNQYLSYEFVHRQKSFIEAVKKYTGADKLDVVTHSMGVSVGRKAIKGGTGYDKAVNGSGIYNLGDPL